jgi:hypothetical protein
MAPNADALATPDTTPEARPPILTPAAVEEYRQARLERLTEAEQLQDIRDKR